MEKISFLLHRLSSPTCPINKNSDHSSRFFALFITHWAQAQHRCEGRQLLLGALNISIFSGMCYGPAHELQRHPQIESQGTGSIAGVFLKHTEKGVWKFFFKKPAESSRILLNGKREYAWSKGVTCGILG
ncbi:MAG: hypothetical protein HZB23_02975 [Deltaproteobacteria bacterium]|nr:hypothetical protein [Deltaproteobacteria bacterium]